MATINDPLLGIGTRVGMGVGTVWTPLHTASGPITIGAGGAYRLSMTSGTIAASLAADSELFQFRYVTGAARSCLVFGITVSAAMIVAPAVAVGPINMQLVGRVARAWTADGTLGTAATLTGNNQKLRTGHNTSEVVSARMAATAALGVGTKTLDAQNFGGITAGIYFDLAAGDISSQLIPNTNLLGEFTGGMGFPMVLANQEGFVIRSGLVMPATLTWNLVVNVLWSEVDGF